MYSNELLQTGDKVLNVPYKIQGNKGARLVSERLNQGDKLSIYIFNKLKLPIITFGF